MDRDTSLRPPPDRTVLTRGTTDRLAGRFFWLIALSPIALMLVIIVTLGWRARSILEVKPLGELLTGEVWKPICGAVRFCAVHRRHGVGDVDHHDHRRADLRVVRAVSLRICRVARCAAR